MLNKIIGVYGISSTLLLCVTNIEYDTNDSIIYFFNNKPEKFYKRRVYYNVNGDAYFISQIGRIYLNTITFS